MLLLSRTGVRRASSQAKRRAAASARRPTTGRLVIDSVHHSADELRAARRVAARGRDVVLRDPGGVRSKAGGTADLLVDGVPYDIYTPTTSNANRIISAMRSKNSQARGIVLDLSKSGVSLDDLGNVINRLRGAGAQNLQEVIIIGR
ncbi:hypothetical protein [Haliangium sp.]|uniref:CdiA C-terminal domain-containing protein n=1 Tax=Haliangium sp. TaxID=2663208 RepID=UPI003D096ABC